MKVPLPGAKVTADRMVVQTNCTRRRAEAIGRDEPVDIDPESASAAPEAFGFIVQSLNGGQTEWYVNARFEEIALDIGPV